MTTVPSHEKSYWTQENEAFVIGSPVLEGHQNAMFHVKSTLCAAPQYPWTVHSSSNAAGAGLGDSWSDAVNDLIWGWRDSVAHSWIVLNAPTGPGQLLIDLGHRDAYYCYMWYSPEGLFTGGTILQCPTAPDSPTSILNTSIKWLTGQTTAHNGKVHIIHAVDGTMTMWMFCWSGYVRAGCIWCKPFLPQTGWNIPYCFWSWSAPTTAAQDVWRYGTGSNARGNLNGWAKEALSGDLGHSFYPQFVSEGVGSTATYWGEYIPNANQFSYEYLMLDLYVGSFEEYSYGLLGRLQDLYYAGGGLVTGDTVESIPGSPENKWAVMGNLIVPWPGSTPQVS